MKIWGLFRFGMNAHKPFFICGYSFQNELGFQRDGDSFGPGFPIGARAPCWLGNPKGTVFPWQWFPKAAALPWQEESNETGGFVAHDFVRKVVCVIPLATVGGGKGFFGAGTSTFRQPQNKRILRPPGREAQEFAIAESACSGVGGAAKWRGRAQRSLAMERHHRGSKRDIKPAAASLLLK